MNQWKEKKLIIRETEEKERKRKYDRERGREEINVHRLSEDGPDH